MPNERGKGGGPPDQRRPSAFEGDDTSAHGRPALPRTASTGAPRTASTGAPRTTSTGAPRQTGTAMPALQASAGKAAPGAPKKTGELKTVATSGATTAPKQLTVHQKAQLSSAFADAKRERQREAFFGSTTSSGARLATGTEFKALPPTFDGKTPHPSLTGRDLWKAVQAPAQSGEGARSGTLYRQVLFQFAVAHNPRYAPDAPERPRGHIFVWDVSRAMGCEIPHFVGAKELSLGQTVDWLRHEGPMRGWIRIDASETFDQAEAGLMVVALPREVRLKHMAVVYPQDPPSDYRPLLCGAGLQCGWGLTAAQLFGTGATDYFAHP
jgi:hypothetical protein